MRIYTDTELCGRSLVIEDVLHKEDDEKNYELCMMRENDIFPFLPFLRRREDNMERFLYDIGSMNSLSDLSKKSPLRLLELHMLIKSIKCCQSATSEYMLSEEGVILNPEYIFYDRNKKCLKFCFYPWNDTDVFKSYTKIAEFLLSSIDYNDEDAVKLAYEIYAETLNKNYGFENMITEEEQSAHNKSYESMDNPAGASSETKDLESEYEYEYDDEYESFLQNKKKRSDFVYILLTIVIVFLITGLSIYLFRL